MKALAAAGVGVEYMYAFISRDEGRACVILRFTQEDTDKAVAALQAANIEILDAGRIYSMVNGKSSLRPAGSFLPFEIDRIRRWGLIHTGLRAILNKRAEQPPEKSGGCS